MAIISYVGAELNPANSTFQDWLSKTNDIIGDMGAVVVTIGGENAGDLDLSGNFSANNITSVSSNVEILTVTTEITTPSLNVSNNVTTDSLTATTEITTSSLTVSNNTITDSLTVTGNAAIGSLTVSGNTAMDDISGTSLTLSGNAVVSSVSANSIITETAEVDVLTVNTDLNVPSLSLTDLTVTGNTSLTDVSVSGDLTVTSNTSLADTSASSLSISGTTALKLPVGSTVQRPTGILGHVRVNNSDTPSKMELFNGDSWVKIEEESLFSVESFATVTSTTGAATIDCEIANVFLHALTESVTYTFSNPPASGTAYGFTLKLVQDSTARSVSWPASVRWPSATAPTISTGSGEVDVFAFFTHDGGVNWYGFTAGQVLS